MTDADAAPVLQLREPAHRVSDKARLRWLLGALMWVPIALIGLGVGAFFLGSWLAWVLWVLVVVAGATYLVVMPRLRWQTHRWETTPTAIYTQTGWLGRLREIAPMSRVQTVEFHQDLLDRILGLASVSVSTAADDIAINTLDAPVAEQLSAQLTAAAEADRGDAT